MERYDTPLVRKLQRIWLIMIAIFVIGTVLFFGLQWKQFKRNMRALHRIEVAGIYQGYEDRGRGDLVVFITRSGRSTRCYLPNFKRYLPLISVGDSLRKPVDNDTFYRWRRAEKGFVPAGKLPIGY